ncbi:CBM_HP2_G0032330.mRNA.1.CDS.1 [Saccharomyces cerevisiae]|nr:CBM_HP2_G0032330.mRNA.1.CDS.1 [Saccharomyces cerevisiae]CAI6586711.1 CBM_HP2_G0032330.mRNA.1.CDS.1 [Saccharomyces cerevisiae]
MSYVHLHGDRFVKMLITRHLAEPVAPRTGYLWPYFLSKLSLEPSPLGENRLNKRDWVLKEEEKNKEIARFGSIIGT